MSLCDGSAATPAHQASCRTRWALTLSIAATLCATASCSDSEQTTSNSSQTGSDVANPTSAGPEGNSDSGDPAAPDDTDAAAEPNTTETPLPPPNPADGGKPAASPITVPINDIPVGNVKIVPAGSKQVAVAQTQLGTFVAYEANTPDGTPLVPGDTGELRSPLDGSRFSLVDGKPLGGPATEPLTSINVTIDGDTLNVG